MGFIKGLFSVVFGFLALIGGIACSTSLIGGAVYGAYEIYHFNTELLPAIGWGAGFAILQYLVGMLMAYLCGLVVVVINWE